MTRTLIVASPTASTGDPHRALITGANKGLGYATAEQLLELGHTVYVGSRDVERTDRGTGYAVSVTIRNIAPITSVTGVISKRSDLLRENRFSTDASPR